MLLPMLRATQRKKTINTRMLVLPFAELSVIVFWYFWIIETLILDLITQKTRNEVTKPKRGIASSSPVPASLLIEIFPCERDYILDTEDQVTRQPFQGIRWCRA